MAVDILEERASRMRELYKKLQLPDVWRPGGTDQYKEYMELLQEIPKPCNKQFEQKPGQTQTIG